MDNRTLLAFSNILVAGTKAELTQFEAMKIVLDQERNYQLESMRKEIISKLDDITKAIEYKILK